MDETPFYQRPWFFFIFPPIAVIIVYFLTAPQGVDDTVHFREIIKNLAIYFVILIIWLAFFAQFVLPVQTFEDRQKIFDRLLAYLFGAHGPAIFFRDGQPIKREGEERKKGPGVLWLDSASGVVTRTAAEFKNTFGAGVHFTTSKEKIAGYVDLHIQIDSIGPREKEDPSASKAEQQDKLEYDAIQQRRMQTTALTRDGIEVVPNISVVFKIDADPVLDPNLPGSRFGFDANAVFRAVTGEPINTNMPKESFRYRIPWNQLPALLAADAWRDLLSKFTLNDLFEQKYLLPPSFSNEISDVADNSPLHNPVVPQSRLADNITETIKELNRVISRLSDWIDTSCNPEEKNEPENKSIEIKKETPKGKKVTGLQVINFLVRERLQKQKVAVLDQYGNYQPGSESSSLEYNFLQGRGIRIISVSVNNLRFPAEVDAKLINQWTATWLLRARAEHERLDQEEGYNRIQNEENALRDYVVQLSNDLLLQLSRNRARDLRETLRALMMESRAILVNENQLHRRSSTEREALEDNIQWLEKQDQ